MPDFLLSPLYDLYLKGTDEIPWGLYHLQLAYAEQLCSLAGYSPNSIKLVMKHLKTLRDNGYMQAFVMPTRSAGKPLYYTLGANGVAYLAELGYDIKGSWRASQEERESYTYVKHLLEVNDVLISAMLLRKADPTYWLDSLKHDHYLRQHPQAFTWNGVTVKIIPDGVLKFQTPTGARMVLLEHETWSQQQTKFRQKIHKYIAMLQTERIPIIFTTFRGEAHVSKMREWTLEELTITHQPKSIGVYFRFASLEKPLNPATVWLSTHWRTPYDDPPHSLLAA